MDWVFQIFKIITSWEMFQGPQAPSTGTKTILQTIHIFLEKIKNKRPFLPKNTSFGFCSVIPQSDTMPIWTEKVNIILEEKPEALQSAPSAEAPHQVELYRFFTAQPLVQHFPMLYMIALALIAGYVLVWLLQV